MGMVDTTRQSVATDVTYKDGVTYGNRTTQAERAAWLRYKLVSAGGSWGREFRLLLTLADERGESLDTDTLTFYDVRDLQALQRCYAAANGSHGRRVARH